MRRHCLFVFAAALGGAAVAGVPVAYAAGPDRPMGRVFDRGHELSQRRLPAWNTLTGPPIPVTRWYRAIDAILRRAGQSGMWFSGYTGLPFDIPLDAREPRGWRTPGVLAREFRATGLSWDVNVEARAATIALARGQAVVSDPATRAPTRRLSLLDPAYERAALDEIRRLIPATPSCRTSTPTPDPTSPSLRWLAYSRETSDRFFDMKERQARLIHRLDPGANVVPNDDGFLDGFMPWDYTRLSAFADIVEADPYVSLLERATPGRGRYNPGFAAKLLRTSPASPCDRDQGVSVRRPHARARRPRDLDGTGAASRGDPHLVLRSREPPVHRPSPLPPNAGHRTAPSRHAPAGRAAGSHNGRGVRDRK